MNLQRNTLERIYNESVNFSFFQKEGKMDFVTFFVISNFMQLFTTSNFFNYGYLSIYDIQLLGQNIPFYSLFLENKFIFLKNLIFYTNIAKGMKIDDADYLLNTKKTAKSFTPYDVEEAKFNFEHSFLLFR